MAMEGAGGAAAHLECIKAAAQEISVAWISQWMSPLVKSMLQRVEGRRGRTKGQAARSSSGVVSTIITQREKVQ